MIRLRVCLTLALTLLLLGNGAWTPANHIAAADSLASAGLAATDLPILHVESIEAGYKASGHYFYNIFADVQIRDEDNNPVYRAMVYSEWSLDGGPILEIQGKTDKSGHAGLGLRAGLHGTWNVCVVNVQKSGWDFDPDWSVSLCDSVDVP
jgi:hypothetical protein